MIRKLLKSQSVQKMLLNAEGLDHGHYQYQSRRAVHAPDTGESEVTTKYNRHRRPGRPFRRLGQSTYSERLGRRLRHLRTQAGLTVPQAVERLKEAGFDASWQTYYAWEVGFRKLNWEALPALAKVLGVADCRGLLPPR